MTHHYLACGSQYFWCSDEHANGWALLLLLGAIAAAVVIMLIIGAAMAYGRR